MLGRFAGLTARGRYLLAAGLATALCAVLINERDLLRVAAFTVMLPLLASVVVGHLQLTLRAQRELMPSRITVGSECQERLTLHGPGWCGGRLLLEEVLPRTLGGSRRAVVAGLLRHGVVELNYQLRPPQRWVYSLGPLIVRITDPLGLAEYSCTLAGHSRLVIPAVVVLTGLAAGGDQGPVRQAAGEWVSAWATTPW